jgi:predicted DNA-binding transcriptional regulator AlpA
MQTSTVAQPSTNAPARDRLIGTGEVADLLNCHVISVYRWLRERSDFPVPIRISPNRLAWRQGAILDYIASRPRREQRTLVAGDA